MASTFTCLSPLIDSVSFYFTSTSYQDPVTEEQPDGPGQREVTDFAPLTAVI